MQLENQIAVVTGAGRGIGRAIALKFAREGANVVCVSRTQENSDKVAAEVTALGRKSWALAVDVADGAAVKAAHEPSPANGRSGMPSTCTATSARAQPMRTTPSFVVVALVPAAAPIFSASRRLSWAAKAHQAAPQQASDRAVLSTRRL